VNAAVHLARAEPARPAPGLGAARLARSLTVEEAARRAGLLPDEVTWLEEGRVYRFRSTDEALAAAVLYAAALGVDHGEARRLAGLPRSPLARSAYGRGRLLSLAAVAASLLALGFAIALPERPEATQAAPHRAAAQAPALPPPWRISVDVLNGSGDILHTRRVASRIGALAYHVERVARADRFDYPQTVVFHEPGGQDVAVRLARSLGVVVRPLPGGTNPRRLVVVVGPAKGPAG
jgi:transcriptional regulator with XRE-family HTH domain